MKAKFKKNPKNKNKQLLANHLHDTAKTVSAMQAVLVAGGEILRDEFGFTQEQMNDWVTKTVAKARANQKEAK